MTAINFKQLCRGAFRRSTARLRGGRVNAAEALSKSSSGLYPETLSIRYRYQSDGSIVVVTPKGPRYFDDLMDFWSTQDRASSSAASPSRPARLALPTSERHLRALVIMLSVLVLVFFAHQIAGDFAGGSTPEPVANAGIPSGNVPDVEITGALAVPWKDAKQSKTNSPPRRGTVRVASAQVDAGAQFAMGYAYEEGQGRASNFIEAMKWYRLAAEQGHVTAQYKLGLMYGQGRGATRDLVEAHRWMTRAASRPPVPESGAQNRNAAVALTTAQLAKANRLVRNWEQQGAGR